MNWSLLKGKDNEKTKTGINLVPKTKKNQLFLLSSPHINFSRMTEKKVSPGRLTKFSRNGAFLITTCCPRLMVV